MYPKERRCECVDLIHLTQNDIQLCAFVHYSKPLGSIQSNWQHCSKVLLDIK